MFDLSATAKTEHYEIAAYRGLIEKATLMGQKDCIRLLQENLGQARRDGPEGRADQPPVRKASCPAAIQATSIAFSLPKSERATAQRG